MQVHLLERSQNNHIRELSGIVQNSLAINYGEFESVVFLVAFGLATRLGISKGTKELIYFSKNRVSQNI